MIVLLAALLAGAVPTSVAAQVSAAASCLPLRAEAVPLPAQ